MSASETEIARLDRILRSLSPDDVVFLARRPLPRWAVQARRLDDRDETIRRARSFLPDMVEGVQAQTLSRDLSRYLSSAWQRTDNSAPPVDGYRGALHRIALLNHGEPIGQRQILNVFRHSRGCTYRST
jgi:hypothetical protein